MKPYYKLAGVSKQAHQQYSLRQLQKQDRTTYYLGLMEQARVMHPVIGLAKIYYLYMPAGIGREAFEHLGKAYGYCLESQPRLSWRGTRVIPYQNLLAGKRFVDIYQIWVTDITYYRIGSIYYYISMIMDLYSRKIIAFHLADTLQAKHSMALLKRAIKHRPLPQGHQLIHHSDKGTQYTCHAYTQLLKKHQIGISMCNSVYENTHMERLNGIIKNDYLIHWNPTSFSQLKRLLKRAVANYNNCPHGQLDMLSPNQFEQTLKDQPISQRTSIKVFTHKREPKKIDPAQLQLFCPESFVNQKGQHNPV